MNEIVLNESDSMDVPARIISRLLVLLPRDALGYSAVVDALVWLRKTDQPTRWLNASVRDMMEELSDV